MKKIFFLSCLLGSVFCPDFTFSQTDPIETNSVEFRKSSIKNNLTKTTQNWNLLFHYDIEQYFGSLNSAAVYLPDYDEIWISKWATNDIAIWEFSNDTLSYYYEITIEGVSNIRGMTYTGGYIYAGNGSDTISIIDPLTFGLAGHIIAPEIVRYITFNPGADNGNGGFWIGSFYTDPTLIDMSGNYIGSLPYSTLGSETNYGAAFDYYSTGGPYLWLWGYGAGKGTPQVIIQVDPATGSPTGVEYDVRSDPVIGQDSCVAGGLFISDSFSPGKIILGGVLQGNPDILFAYDITDYSSGNPPSVTTSSAVNVTATSATLNGIVNPNNYSTTVIFEYGTTTSYGNKITAIQSPVSGSSDVNVSADLTSLSPKTIYHYRIQATNSAGISWGSDKTFTTTAIALNAPTAATGSATFITGNSATLNGTVNSNNYSTTAVFEYGTTTAYGNEIIADQNPITGSADVNVSADLTGLQSNTIYHYRLKAANANGTTTGENQSFTTAGPPPIAETVQTSNISAGSVTVNGIINPQNSITIVTFLYGTSTAYDKQAGALQSPVPAGLNDIDVSAVLTGLLPNTTYHFCIEATSINGTVHSPDATFKTYIQSVNLNTTFTFTDPTQQSSYKMIGLPGANSLLISQVVTGTNKKDWNAYYDNGNTQDYLVEFDGSANFNFVPGKGFWILSKNPFSINQSVSAVALSADNTYSISIHAGWNIISNPFEKTINWSDIANQNGLNSNEIIYYWNGSTYTNPSTFETYKGYYFNNIVTTRTILKVPYSFIGKISKEQVPEKSNEGRAVKLSLVLNKEEVSGITAGINPLSKMDFDNLDYFAPPGDFADIRIHIENNNLSLPYKQLFIDYRPEIKDGQIYDLKIRNASKKNVNLVHSGVENFSDSEVYLLDENLNRFYNLKYMNEIYISPVHKNYNYKLLIGDTDFINDIKKTYMPDGYLLYQNYPNPFNPSTVIKYQIPDDNTLVELKVFNILGRELITLVNEEQDQGIYEVELNSSGLSSGIYFYTLKAGGYSETKKMILIK